MAIKIIRVCDICNEEHEQAIREEQEEILYSINFICADCIIKK